MFTIQDVIVRHSMDMAEPSQTPLACVHMLKQEACASRLLCVGDLVLPEDVQTATGNNFGHYPPPPTESGPPQETTEISATTPTGPHRIRFLEITENRPGAPTSPKPKSWLRRCDVAPY